MSASKTPTSAETQSLKSTLRQKVALVHTTRPDSTYHLVARSNSENTNELLTPTRIKLYRFLTENLPVVNAAVSTWVRLSAVPGCFSIVDTGLSPKLRAQAESRLTALTENLHQSETGRPDGLVGFLAQLFLHLYRDGLFGGFLIVRNNGGGVERFLPIDALNVVRPSENGAPGLFLNLGGQLLNLNLPDFYHLPLNADNSCPLGRSILQPIPFVAYIEQRLVDDMRRVSRNAGYHRMHVRVTPPERMGGEADSAYIERINQYFDASADMIRTCDVDENPVTWDNVDIRHIGPQNVHTVTNSWFLNHRAMIEEVCAGTNLAPFLLGYSFGATSTWSSFKFDVVMRQVRSIQAQVASFLEWIGNIDLALAGFNARCCFQFDNRFAYQAQEEASIRSKAVEDIIRLYQAGLLDEASARQKASECI